MLSLRSRRKGVKPIASEEDLSPATVPRIAELQNLLLRWYDASARDLPWRRSRDPYAILVSEVMLQQTQVDRVIPKYLEFLAAFPTLTALADATPAAVIRAWAPLGYNRRAVNLHRLAVAVVRDHGGRLPDDIALLRRLPGIGEYTAAALACFAFGRQCAVVDTNVRRVLGRLEAANRAAPLTEREIGARARAYLPAGRAADWNQALMDLGATICRASAPACLLCPLRRLCPSRGTAVRERRTGWKLRSSRIEGERFQESDRYYRGRIVDVLRGAGTLSTAALAAQLGLDGEDGHERLSKLLSGLSADGLVRFTGPDSAAVELPD